jgi:hypothetical protein
VHLLCVSSRNVIVKSWFAHLANLTPSLFARTLDHLIGIAKQNRKAIRLPVEIPIAPDQVHDVVDSELKLTLWSDDDVY